MNIDHPRKTYGDLPSDISRDNIGIVKIRQSPVKVSNPPLDPATGIAVDEFVGIMEGSTISDMWAESVRTLIVSLTGAIIDMEYSKKLDEYVLFCDKAHFEQVNKAWILMVNTMEGHDKPGAWFS